MNSVKEPVPPAQTEAAAPAPVASASSMTVASGESCLPSELEERRKAGFKSTTNPSEVTQQRAQDVQALQQKAKETFMQQKRDSAVEEVFSDCDDDAAPSSVSSDTLMQEANALLSSGPPKPDDGGGLGDPSSYMPQPQQTVTEPTPDANLPTVQPLFRQASVVSVQA